MRRVVCSIVGPVFVALTLIAAHAQIADQRTAGATKDQPQTQCSWQASPHAGDSDMASSGQAQMSAVVLGGTGAVGACLRVCPTAAELVAPCAVCCLLLLLLVLRVPLQAHVRGCGRSFWRVDVR
jgi:hypothetical protein